MSGFYEYVQQDHLQNLLIVVEAALLRCCCYDTLLVVNDCFLFAKSPMKGEKWRYATEKNDGPGIRAKI
jgi:hypothetical protein